MGNLEKLNKESEKLKVYELNVNKTQEEATELGYRDMNLRFLDMEQSVYKPGEWAARKSAHQEKKKQIEAAWHNKTSKRAKELKKSGKKGFSDKEMGYYSNFTLKDMEIFLKNSDRGGNSDEFNSVTTDLELYNVVKENGEANEAATLLMRIKESCDRYISTRKPLTSKGKRRKAMIQQVAAQVERLIEDTKTGTMQREQEKYEAYTSLSENATMEEKTRVTEEACKSAYDKMYLDLQGMSELTEEQRSTMDTHMEKILEGVRELSKDENQSPNLSTKFFNSIGWSAHKPRLCGGFGEEEKKSPLKIKMYHSINTFEPLEDCKGLAEQLKGARQDGKNRQYYSAGNYGKGTYTAARSVFDSKGKTEEEKEEMDQRASRHSWKYGENEGSVQLTMMLNEKARIIDFKEAMKLMETFKEKYPKVYRFFQDKELKEGYNGAVYPAITAMLSFFGYNTLKFERGDGNDIDYYITTDRGAFSIDENAQFIRKGDEKLRYDF